MRWTAVGALVTSATLAHLLASPAVTPIDAAVARTERQIGAWDSPQYLIEQSYRISLVPADRVRGTVKASPVQAAQTAQVFRFAIAPSSIASALREYQALTGIAVNVGADVLRNLTTDGVIGTFTAEDGLTRLLAGSSLSHRFTDAKTVAIEIRVMGQSVDVTSATTRVESVKYPDTLTEIPQTIQVIPRALLEEQGATTLSDALRNVPGITMQAGEGGGASSTSGDMFNMRGFSANNSLFVDGVRDDGLVTRDVFNLEQIEVFSGPTGSDVGRTNAAGYINLTTKSPALGAMRSAGVSFGSGENLRGTVDVNQPISFGRSGTWLGNSAVRINALWQDGGVAGRREVERESKSLAPSMAFGLGTSTRVTVMGQVMRQDNMPDYGLPAASPVGAIGPTGIVAATPVNQTNYYGSPDVDYDRVKQDNVTVRLDHDVNADVALHNQTRYNRTERSALITSIGNAAAYSPATNLVTLSRQANDRENRIVSNQTNLGARIGTGSIEHEISTGFEVSSEYQFSPTLAGVGTRAAIDLNDPDVSSPVTGIAIAPTGAIAEGKTNTVAFYLFDGVDLNARTRVTGGIRAERYDTRSHAVSATGVVTDIDGKGTLVSGKAGLLYRLHRQGNVYVSYGSSLTPPGSANFQFNAGATNQNNPNVDPQKSINYEVGTKWDLVESRLQLSGAVFHTKNTNVIFVVDSAAIPPVFNQDDGQKLTGLSIAAIGQIAPWWNVNLSIQYLDSARVSQNPANDGKFLTLTPKTSGSLWTTFVLPHSVRLGGGVRFIDDTFINTANTIVSPGYSVVDALIEAPVGNRLTLRLNIYNLTDEVYIRNVNNNGGRYNPGAPRSFLLGSSFRF